MRRHKRSHFLVLGGVFAVFVCTMLALVGGFSSLAHAELTEADCRVCHADPVNSADAHHLLVGLSCAESKTLNEPYWPYDSCQDLGGNYDCAGCHPRYSTGTWPVGAERDCLQCHFQAPITRATLTDGKIDLTGSGFNQAISSNIVYVDRVDDPLADCSTTIVSWTDQNILADSDLNTDLTYCAKWGDTVVIPCAVAEVVLQDPLTHIPAPAAHSISVYENRIGWSQISPNDPDIGDVHTFTLSIPPAHGTAAVSPTGLVTYTPDPVNPGPDSLTVTVTDQAGNSGSVTISITVILEPVPPASYASPLPGEYHEQVTVTLSVTDNLDPNPVIHYTVDGSVPTLSSPVYASPLTFTSATTLQYFAVDWRGNEEAVHTALYTITPNYAPAPTAPSISITQVNVGTSLISPNDPNPGDVHTYRMNTAPAYGSATVDAGGLVTYYPNLDYVGQDSLIVTVSDQAGGSGSVTISITVNPAPPSKPWYVNSATGSDNNPGDQPSLPFATINAAVGWAQDGHTINVAQGTYIEEVVVDGLSSLAIQGGWNDSFSEQDPSVFTTTLIGDTTNIGFRYINCIHCTLDGFTITDFQEGVYASGTQSIVQSLLITRNTVTRCGYYGIHFHGCYVVIDNNRVVENANHAIYGIPDYEITRGDFYNNYVGHNGGGGMYIISNKEWKIFNNMIVYNLWGVGASHPGMRARVYNNTIMYNTDAGCWTGYYGNMYLKNTIIAFNGGYGIDNTQQNYMNTEYCNVYGNTAGDYNLVTPNPTDISVDPDVDADYRLTQTSSCIDAGMDLSTYLTDDFEGDPRAVTVGGDGLYDIGADESIHTNNLPEPTAPTISVTESALGTSQISPNDPDPGDVHVYGLTAGPARGTATVDASGLVTYSPNPDYVGSDSLTVTVTDQAGGSGTVTITITVNPETDPPVSSAAPAEGLYQETVTVTLSATDNLDPSPVIYYTVDGSAPTQASPVYATPMTFPITTTLQFFAVDRRNNAEAVNTALYTINHAPRPSALDIIVSKGKTGTSQIDPGDPDAGDTHSYLMTVAPINGTATVDPSGLVTYTPNSGWGGQDSLTVEVADQNGGSGTVTITIYVADTPCTDDDRDGYSPEGGACGPVDCDPIDSEIHPGATEICGNSVDENCDWVAELCTIHDVAVTSLRVPSKVRNCSSRTKRIRAEISNPGEFPEIVGVQLTANGSQLEQSVTLDPGSVARVSFDLNPSSLVGSSAEICVKAVIPFTDAVPEDNSACSTITVVNCQ